MTKDKIIEYLVCEEKEWDNIKDGNGDGFASEPFSNKRDALKCRKVREKEEGTKYFVIKETRKRIKVRYGSHGEEDADIEFYRQDAKNGHENAEHFQAERDIARAEVERLKKLVDDLHVQGYKDRDEASAELAALTIENERLKKIETEYAEFAKAIFSHWT